jgi:hypothetical protein
MHLRHETGVHHPVLADDDAEAAKSLSIHTRGFTGRTERPDRDFDARFGYAVDL